MTRRTIVSDVVRRRNVSRISIAAASDFVGMPNTAPPGVLFPYCLDFLRARALYVGGVDADAVQAAAFYYLHLRRHASQLASVPIEQLAPAAAVDDPVFLFSPGRCGSTLMSRVLYEAGIASVSEPDFYTQLAAWFWSRSANPLAPPFHAAMRRMSGDLIAALGQVPVVKLRAECARAPHLFVAGPERPAIMLFRRFDTWSRSTAQAFAASPAKAVGKYMTALRCLAWLRNNSRCHLARYEDWLSDPVAASRSLGEFLGRPVSNIAVARAMGSHSQAGTPLESRIRPGWEQRWAGAMALWHTPRLVTARNRLDLPNVWD